MKPWDYYSFRNIESKQWASFQMLKEIQSKKLRKIIDYAYKNVNYYRRMFNELDIDPVDIRSKEDLTEIPITTREMIQSAAPKDLISKKIIPSQLKAITTAGSCGKPLTLYIRQKEFDLNNLYWARASRANGQKLFGSAVYFKYDAPPRFWFEKLGIWKKNIVPITETLEEKISKLKQIKPIIIRGNAYELTSIAQYILDQGVKGIKPKKIFSMGSLLDKKGRKLLEQVFQAEIFDYYAATECGLIAWECSQHQGYHINMDAVVLELITNNKTADPGKPGRVICTNLNYKSMPIIRYDLGDIGILTTNNCPCNRKLPLLKKIEGRADDFFIDNVGNLYSPSDIINKVKSIPGIRAFKLIQLKNDLIQAEIVTIENSKTRITKLMNATLKTIMGEKMLVKINFCSRINRDPERKIRAMISYVKR